MWIILKYCAVHIGIIELALLYTREKYCPGIVSTHKINLGSIFVFLPYFLHNMIRQPLIFLCYPWIVRWIFPIKHWKDYLEITFHFFCCQCMLGGIGIILQKMYGFPVVYVGILCYLFLYLFLEMRGRGKRKECSNVCSVQMVRNGVKIEVNGFIDTGNLLRDPLSGKGIYLLDLSKCYPLLQDREVSLFKRYEETGTFPWDAQIRELLSEIHPISFSSIGETRGNLPVILAEQITIRRGGSCLQEKNGRIGICTKDIFKEHVWDVLLPSDIEPTKQK